MCLANFIARYRSFGVELALCAICKAKTSECEDM
jgi:hypothetical protein